MNRRLIVGMCAILLGPGAEPPPLHGQEIPRNRYLRYLPLQYPVMVRQTEASVTFQLLGDPGDPGYRDNDPVDGIDDRRHQVLLDLGVRFAPYLVLNTTAVPMDVRLFMQPGRSFPLFVDTWDVSRDPAMLVGSDEIEWATLPGTPCESVPSVPLTENPDCRLRALLDEFDPLAPGPAHRTGAITPEQHEFRVLFFDLPGDNEKTWRAEYENQFVNPRHGASQDFPRVYVHPFLTEVRASGTVQPGYEVVLQYWFFYPFNDGGNNHEGDWEHINVIVTPLNKLAEPLSAADVRRILSAPGLSDTAPDRLVIRRVEYYFHHHVMTLDYTRPNVYQPRKQWEKEVDTLVTQRRGAGWFWTQIRNYAYWDDDETIINTHPIGFIGADNKGTDQLLKPPGGSNRDSHGTYPFSGLYKDVGPAGAAEQIGEHFDHRKHFAEGSDDLMSPQPRYRRGSVASFASPQRIEIVPDGERVLQLVKQHPKARRDWAWLVLPIRWGYPAARSPFAGLVEHAATGNSSVVGPSYNGAWNRIGAAAGFQNYEPHRFGSLLPTTWQDGFANNLGYLNLTVPTLAVLPPFDFFWRVVAAPLRTLFGTQDPVYQTSENIPFRFVGLVVSGVSYMDADDDLVNLFLSERQVDDIGERFLSQFIRADSVVGQQIRFIENTTLSYFEISLYLGKRFASENTLRAGRMPMGVDVTFPTIGEVFRLRGDLSFVEYSGSIRYSLTTSRLMPFIKGGYGLSWYRVENASTNGDPLPQPDGPWVGQPTIEDLSSFLPDTWHIGGGFEWVPLQSRASFPRGIDLGIRAELLLYYVHSLGTGIQTVVPTPSGIDIPAGSASAPSIVRTVYNLALTVSF